ncbi:MAG: hypothetical protein AB9891_11155 [Anaerolineaceae bacterium]
MSEPLKPLTENTSRPLRTGWEVFFIICGLESLAALIWLGLISGDPKNGILLGFSSSRLALMLIVCLAAVFFLASFCTIHRSDRWFSKLAAITGLNPKGFSFSLFWACRITDHRVGISGFSRG